MTKRRSAPWIWIGLLLLILVAAATGALWHRRHAVWATLSSQERTQAWIASLGPWGPLAAIGLNTAQVLLGPVPGHFIGWMNGYLYGVWLGTLYSMAGLLVGTALAMGLARRFGRPFVERLVKPQMLARWDRITNQRGPLFFFLIYLIPGLPDDLVCFIVGLSQLDLRQMIVLAMLGRLPGVIVSCWVGAYATELPSWAWLPLATGTAGLAWLFWHYRERIEAGLVRLIARVTGQRRPMGGPEDAGAEEERRAHR
jgi:uncharacterized membrane protein YdjX (TVP38/TMEM64 family)